MIMYYTYDELPPGADPLTYEAKCSWCTNQATFRIRHVGSNGELLGECLCDDCENRFQSIIEEANRRATMGLNSQAEEELYNQFFGGYELDEVASMPEAVARGMVTDYRNVYKDEYRLTDREIATLVQDYAVYQTVLSVES
jgi:hypothetical protein